MQGDADAVGPRSYGPPSSVAAPSSSPSLRQEEKGEGGSDGGAAPAIGKASAKEEEEEEEEKKAAAAAKKQVVRHLFLRTAGRVLGLALRNGMPLGVVLPPAVCRALLDADDPAVPKHTLVLPGPVESGAVAEGQAAAHVQEEQEQQQPEQQPEQQQEQQQQQEGRGDGDGGGKKQEGGRRRRRGKGGGKGKDGDGGGGPGLSQGQGRQQAPAPSPNSISMPLGRWREYVGDDAVLARSLEALLAHDFDSPSSSAFALEGTCFTVTEEGEGGGPMREVELVPGGARLAVTNANKAFFVELVARRRLLRGAEMELWALKLVRKREEGGGFMHACMHDCLLSISSSPQTLPCLTHNQPTQGLLDVVPARFLALFSPTELSGILSGPRSIDFTQLRRVVQYERGLGAHSPVVQALWEVVLHDFTLDEQRRFLLFWSGSSTPPALGFAQRTDDEFAWTVSRLTGEEVVVLERGCVVRGGGRHLTHSIQSNNPIQSKHNQPPGPGVSAQSLPEASTCDRRLSLPEYPSAALLRTKLRAAITHGCVGYDRV